MRNGSPPSIFLNFALSGGAQALSRLLRFIACSLIIRIGGMEAWGGVAFALTVVGYVSFAMDLGISALATARDVDNTREDRIFFLALGPIRFLASVPVIAVALLLVVKLAPAGGEALCLYLLTLLARPWALDWFFQRKGYSGVFPLVQLGKQAIFVSLLALGGIHRIQDIVLVDVVLEILTNLATWLIGPKHHFGFPLPRKGEWSQIRSCYWNASPLFAASACYLVSQSVDIVLIRSFLGLVPVGVYDYSNRLLLFTVFIGGALSIPLRRQLARIQSGDLKASSSDLIGASHRLMTLLSLGFAFFALYFSPWFFSWTIPAEHVNLAVTITRIFSVYLILSFISIPLAEWLLVHVGRKSYLHTAILSGSVNLVVNLVLIQIWGTPGAAWAKVIAESAILIFLFSRLPGNCFRESLPFFAIGGVQIIWIGSALTVGVSNPLLILLHATLTIGLLVLFGFAKPQNWRAIFHH